MNFLIELDDLALGLIGSMSLANEAMNILSRTATSSEEFAMAADAASVAADVSAGGGLRRRGINERQGPRSAYNQHIGRLLCSEISAREAVAARHYVDKGSL